MLFVAAQIPVGIKYAGKKTVNYNESKKGRKNSKRRINMETGGEGFETIISHFHGTSR
jgi:hypothetical protein